MERQILMELCYKDLVFGSYRNVDVHKTWETNRLGKPLVNTVAQANK